MIKNLPGVQDVFCGTETIVHMKSGSAALDAASLKEALSEFDIVCEGVERDDSRLL